VKTLTALKPVPLVVDLDGTLVATDTLWESLLVLIKTSPAKALRVPLWLLGGKAQFKAAVARHVLPNPQSLPYREDLLEFLRGAREDGRPVILATAAHQDVAARVCDHLGLFTDVIASTPETNMAGARKLHAIKERLGGQEFDYVGDSSADIPVWQAARRALVAAPSPGLLSQSRSIQFEQAFGRRPGKLRAMTSACRPYQWAKNLLIFVPLLLAYRLSDLALLGEAAVAFVCLSLTASGVYVTNDLLDLHADRAHPVKRRRPFASGALSIPTGIGMAAGLFAGGLVAAVVLLPGRFALALLLYAGITFSYSFYFKRLLILDVLCLAGLYTLRILAGGCLPGLFVSEWLLAFSMFFFLSLAFVKRFTEILVLQDEVALAELPGSKLNGRNYYLGDVDLVRTLGLVTGVTAVLVFSLYVSSDFVHKNYRHPEYLWAINPVLLYWVCRVWFLAQRRQLAHDPVVFALRDRHSYLAGAIAVLIVLAAK
jgi:4-hydroxybenzoate polyprenyltransferase/phosphoglycolate phosphatase-like HAD superfamily hydrolase